MRIINQNKTIILNLKLKSTLFNPKNLHKSTPLILNIPNLHKKGFLLQIKEKSFQ